jgi:hypothetical protein
MLRQDLELFLLDVGHELVQVQVAVQDQDWRRNRKAGVLVEEPVLVQLLDLWTICG